MVVREYTCTCSRGARVHANGRRAGAPARKVGAERARWTVRRVRPQYCTALVTCHARWGERSLFEHACSTSDELLDKSADVVDLEDDSVHDDSSDTIGLPSHTETVGKSVDEGYFAGNRMAGSLGASVHALQIHEQSPPLRTTAHHCTLMGTFRVCPSTC